MTSVFQHLGTDIAGADVSFCWHLLVSETLLLSRVVALGLASSSDIFAT